MTYLGVTIGGSPTLVHAKTGKPVHLVRREIISEFEEPCECCGKKTIIRRYNYSPDKRIKPENITEVVAPPTKAYIPVYPE